MLVCILAENCSEASGVEPESLEPHCLGLNPLSFIDWQYDLKPNPLNSIHFPLCKMKIILSFS